MKVTKVVLDTGAYMPEYAHDGDAGMDLRTPVARICSAHGSVTIDTGVHVQIPYGYVGFLKSKSGLNVKNGIIGDGTIDYGYTGSIRVKLYNLSDEDYVFSRGDKIIQLVIQPVEYLRLEKVNELEETERGDNGFGSTGR